MAVRHREQDIKHEEWKLETRWCVCRCRYCPNPGHAAHFHLRYTSDLVARHVLREMQRTFHRSVYPGAARLRTSTILSWQLGLPVRLMLKRRRVHDWVILEYQCKGLEVAGGVEQASETIWRWWRIRFAQPLDS